MVRTVPRAKQPDAIQTSPTIPRDSVASGRFARGTIRLMLMTEADAAFKIYESRIGAKWIHDWENFNVSDVI